MDCTLRGQGCLIDRETGPDLTWQWALAVAVRAALAGVFNKLERKYETVTSKVTSIATRSPPPGGWPSAGLSAREVPETPRFSICRAPRAETTRRIPVASLSGSLSGLCRCLHTK
jgi:hypothetical protein